MDGLNILVTETGKQFEGFTTISSITALEKVSRVGILVFNSSSDSPTEVVHALRKISIEDIIYLANEDKIQDEIKVFIQGSGGAVVTDEFYLHSKEAFRSLLQDFNRSTELMSTNSVDAIQDFLGRLSEGDTEFSKPYLTTIMSATDNLSVGYRDAKSEIKRVVKTAVNMFESVSTDLDSVTKKNRDLARQAQETQKLIEETTSGPEWVSTQVYRFAPIEYKKRKKAIQIKEIGNVPYIHSFALGLLEYFIRAMKHKSRIIVVLPVAENYEEIYSDVPESSMITKVNYTQRRLYRSPITYTSYPTVTVMDRLLTDEYDSYVILDRSNNSVKPILRNPPGQNKLKTFYAVQSARTFEKFTSIKKSQSITGINRVSGTMFTIPVFEEYSDKKMRRISTYMEVCRDIYEKMIGKL